VRVGVDVLYLDDIPGAMDQMGWNVSARLMRRWFATTPAWAMPEDWRSGTNIDYLKLPSSQVDDEIIKMKWLLRFDRTVPIFEDLYQGWNRAPGLDLLRRRLKNSGWQPGQKIELGQGLKKAKELDLTCQINKISFGGLADTMDDLFGAVFKATLKIAVVGKTSRSFLSKRDFFEIERVGIYLLDTYDFNANWFEDAFFGLGVWSKKKLLSKKEMMSYMATPLPSLHRAFPGFVPAYNEDFKRWQRQRNEGGDFFVFSDVMWLPPNVEFVYI
jgi:hypothetical protein